MSVTSPAGSPDALAKSAKAEMLQHLHAAVDALDQALSLPSTQIKEEVDVAERAVVRLRDAAIERLRGDSAAEDQPPLKAARHGANVALSLIASVEYPAAKIQRSKLESARGVLQGLVAAGWA